MGRLLGQDKAVEAMEDALKEGKRFDEELTMLAESDINPAMLDGKGDTTGREARRSRNR